MGTWGPNWGQQGGGGTLSSWWRWGPRQGPRVGGGHGVTPACPLQNGKHDEAWMVLKQVHDTNMRAKGHPERVFSVRTPGPGLGN